MKIDIRREKYLIEWILVFVFIVIFIVSFIVDKGMMKLPSLICVDKNLRGEMERQIFSAQVSISTLGIALVAILGGILKDEIYGVNITEYITNKRPKIFTHKRIIIVQLILVILSVVVMEFDFYNILQGLSFISIIMTIIMVQDVFSIFKGNELNKVKIKSYILSEFLKNKSLREDICKDIILNLKKSTLNNIDSGNITTVKENLELFDDIIECIYSYQDKERKQLIITLNDSLCQVYNRLFEVRELKEFDEYILNKFNKDNLLEECLECTLLEKLKSSCLKAIDCNNKVTLEDNFVLVKDIMARICYYDEDDRKLILKSFEKTVCDMLDKIFIEKDSVKIIMALELIEQLYKVCNKLNDQLEENKTYLQIYDELSYKIPSAIAVLLLNDTLEVKVIWNMEYELYKNMRFLISTEESKPNLMNHNYLYFYSSWIYNELKRIGFDKYNPVRLQSVKKQLFEEIESYIQYCSFAEFEKEKKKQIYIQLCQYTKVLIDNREVDLLEELFFKRTENRLENGQEDLRNEYILIILIYLYYLAEFDQHIIDVKLREFIRDILNGKSSIVENIFNSIYYYHISREEIEKLNSVLGKWERMPSESVKFIEMPTVIERFLLFGNLYVSWDIESIKAFISTLIIKNEFRFKTAVSNRNIALDYKKFVELFMGENITDERAQEKINQLEYVIDSYYKDSKIKESYTHIKSEKEYKVVEENLRNSIFEKVDLINRKFNNANYNKEIKEKIKLGVISTYNEFLDNKSILEMVEHFYYGMEYKIIGVIYNKLYKERILYKDMKVLLKSLLELNTKSRICSDTLIGYKRNVYGLDKIDEFKMFEKDKFKIESAYINDCIIAIDSSKLYLNISNITIEINKLDIEKVCSELKKNGEGQYLYNITNDLYVPFTNEELKIYLDNEKCEITVFVDIEYEVLDNYIGVGVFLSNEESESKVE